MSVLKVPLHKDLYFESELKRFILHHIDLIYREYKHWPDKITLTGKLGIVIFNIINENNWKFHPVKIKNEKSLSSRMIFEFEKGISVKKNSNMPNIDQDTSLDGKIIEGWSGNKMSDAMSRISPDSSFNIETTEYPKITIKLKEIG